MALAEESRIGSASFDLGPIRPPSEAFSLLIRVTRNCPWNRCKFCSLYKGTEFQLKSVEEIKQEIRTARLIHDEIKEMAEKAGYGGKVREAAGALLRNPPSAAVLNVARWQYAGGENVFLQDSNALVMKTGELAEVIRFLRQTFPDIKRVTSYARTKTVNKKSAEEMVALHQAGLSRLHIGLESGFDPLLKFMDKGATAADHIAAGQKVVASGISLSEYVILGLGGKEWWPEHAVATAAVLNEINPDFIRVRTLVVKPGTPLYQEVKNGSFIRATDEEIIAEEKLLIEHLDGRSCYVSDHITNLLPEIEGQLPQDKAKMLAVIERFQALSPEERAHFRVGRRLGIYQRLDDLQHDRSRQMMAAALTEFRHDGGEIDEEKIYSLMERFI